MSLKMIGISAVARALASPAAIGAVAFTAPTAAAQQTATQEAQAAALAETIAAAVLQALADTAGLAEEEQEAAGEAAMEAAIENSGVSPEVAAVALSRAQMSLAQAGISSPAGSPPATRRSSRLCRPRPAFLGRRRT